MQLWRALRRWVEEWDDLEWSEVPSVLFIGTLDLLLPVVGVLMVVSVVSMVVGLPIVGFMTEGWWGLLRNTVGAVLFVVLLVWLVRWLDDATRGRDGFGL